jgi:hypothetical protein
MKTTLIALVIALHSPSILASDLASEIPPEILPKIVGVRMSEAPVTPTISRMTLRHKLFGRLDLMKRTSGAPTPDKDVLVMLTGLNTGPELVDVLPPPPGVTVLAVNYPVEKNQPVDKQIGEVLTKSIQIQGLITALFLWLKDAPEYQDKSVHVMMVSFGTFATPKPLALAQELGFSPTSTIFAYGGSSIQNFYAPFIASFPPTEQLDKAKKALDAFFVNFDNTRDLQKLRGPFFVLQASEDEIIPFDAGEALFNTLPEPKQRLFIEGPHVQLGRPDMVEKTMIAVLEWIAKPETTAQSADAE